jgi:endonuclease YncB( thermonuclease family)
MAVIRLLTAAVVATASAFLAAPASAATVGPCFAGGPQCTFWTGKVTLVADGDTIDVDTAGDGTSRARRVRMAGYNATELRRYSNYAARRRGECHGVAAANRLEQLIGGSRQVRLAAQHESSLGENGRLRRQVSALIGGQWVDVGPIMLAEGRALAFPASDEWAWNGAYAAAARQAAAAGIGIWNPRGCGPGPRAAVNVTIKAQYHKFHRDERKYLNSEWVKIFNPSSRPLSLRGWWVRDSSLLRYHFPKSAVIRPHGKIKLRIGSGKNRPGRIYHWGLPKPPFNNPSNDRKHIHDGAYLFDRRGNMRAYQLWGG